METWIEKPVLEKTLNGISEAVTTKLDEGKRAAERLAKRGRYALEDCIEDTVRTVKRKPMQSLAIVFATGLFLGFLAPPWHRR